MVFGVFVFLGTLHCFVAIVKNTILLIIVFVIVSKNAVFYNGVAKTLKKKNNVKYQTTKIQKIPNIRKEVLQTVYIYAFWFCFFDSECI